MRLNISAHPESVQFIDLHVMPASGEQHVNTLHGIWTVGVSQSYSADKAKDFAVSHLLSLANQPSNKFLIHAVLSDKQDPDATVDRLQGEAYPVSFKAKSVDLNLFDGPASNHYHTMVNLLSYRPKRGFAASHGAYKRDNEAISPSPSLQ